MPGPYFEGQKCHASCGCYYPDVVRVKDTPAGRVFHCVKHGVYGGSGEIADEDKKLIPSDGWREKERARLRKQGKKNQKERERSRA